MEKRIRQHVVDSLLYVEKKGYIKDILEKKRSQITDERDRRLLQEIVTGSVQNQIYLDYVLDKYVKMKKKLQIELRIILRTAVYQLIFLTRVPEHAVVNEAVILAKKYTNRGGASLVNGILRNILRDKSKAYEIREEDPLRKLSIETSFPLEWVKYFSTFFTKEELKEYLFANNQVAPFSIRALATSREELQEDLARQGFHSQFGKLSDDALILDRPDGIFESQAYKLGFFYVQDEGAQMVVKQFKDKGDYLGLDLCAAPGGKSFQLLDYCQRGVLASDSNPKRLEVMKKNIKRLRIDKERLQILVHNASKPRPEWKGRFDRIVADAPCSGLGLIRRKPEIKNRVSLQDCEDLSRVQLKILESASDALAKNGQIVYSTCTVTKEENESVVEAFLTKHPEFEICGDWVRYWPHRENTDGFSMVILKRRV